MASLQIFHQTNVEKLRTKSILLTTYLALLLSQDPTLKDQLNILTPMNPFHRGSQLSILVKTKDSQEVASKLLMVGIVIDIREPEVIRVTPVPLYNTFHDVWYFFSEIKQLLC